MFAPRHTGTPSKIRSVARAWRKVPHAASRAPIRPTLGAFVALLIAAALFVLGGETVATELTAGALGIGIALATGLISALAAWFGADEGSAKQPDGARRDLLPQSVTHWLRTASRACAAPLISAETAWLQVDQRGRIVGAADNAERPSARGLYRAGGRTLVFRDVFGFWTARRTVPSDRELWIAPRANETPHPVLDALGAHSALYAPVDDSERSSPMVRPYEPGDPLRAISWRQTAHHGQLMSFDPERTRRVMPLVALDTLEVDDADALAAEAASACSALSRNPGARGEVLVTDGVELVRSSRCIGRLLAALQPDVPEGTRGLVDEAKDRARRITRFAAHGLDAHARRPVILISSRRTGALERALTELIPADITVIAPRALTPAETLPADHERSADTDVRADRKARRRKAAAPPPLSSDVPAACCCAAAALASVQLVGTLIAPAGWSAFGSVALPLVAAAAVLVPRLPFARGRAAQGVLGLAVVLLACLAAVARAASILGSAGGVNVFDAASDLGALGIDAPGGGLSLIAPVVASGVHELYYGQWVPVEVSTLSDAALVLILIPVVAIVYPLCRSRRLRPLVASLPLLLQAARVIFMGAANDAAAVALAIACGLALRVLAQPPAAKDSSERPGPPRVAHNIPAAVLRIVRALRPVALVACLVIAIISTACAPRATQAAQGLPIQLDIQSHVLSGSTVNPIMDLRRDLERGAETVALTYRTSLNRPVYLRLSSLGELSGSTWALDSPDSGTSGGLLSALLGADAEDGGPAALPGTSDDAGFIATTFRDFGTTALGDIRNTTTSLTIEALSSRFAPLPIGAYDTDAPDDSQAEGWRWSDTGAVYSENGSTNRGLAYSVQAAYMDPIDSDEDMHAMGQNALGMLWSRAWNSSTVTTAEGQRGIAEQIARYVEEECDAIDPIYLELPESLPGEIESAVDSLRIDSAAEAYGENALTHEVDQLEALLAYFDDARFTYSLEVPDAGDNLDAVARFLETKEGYCAHYASAITVLARALGMPARIALGYRASSAQDADDRYIVTNHDLHTWAEVYLYGIGWMPFDVTPASGDDTPAPAVDEPEETRETEPEQQEQAESEAPEQDSEDPAAGNDDAEVPGSDTPGSEHGFADMLAETTSRIAEALSRAVPVVACIAAVALVLMAPRILRAARRRWRMWEIDRAGTQPARAVEAAWAEALDAARRQGATWGPDATEEDIVRAVSGIAASAEAPLRKLADLVCRVRYGSTPSGLTATDLHRLLDDGLIGDVANR